MACQVARHLGTSLIYDTQGRVAVWGHNSSGLKAVGLVAKCSLIISLLSYSLLMFATKVVQTFVGSYWCLKAHAQNLPQMPHTATSTPLVLLTKNTIQLVIVW
jgi:hypothetical protein